MRVAARPSRSPPIPLTLSHWGRFRESPRRAAIWSLSYPPFRSTAALGREELCAQPRAAAPRFGKACDG
jgi:hypothetical protein